MMQNSKIHKILHLLKMILIWVRFLQIPILAALAASGLAFVAWHGIGPAALVLGAYDGTEGASFLVAPFAVFYALALWDIARVILEYGPARFKAEAFTGTAEIVGKILLAALFSTVPILTALACSKAMDFSWQDWTAWTLSPVILLSGYWWLAVRKHRHLVTLINRVPALRNMRADGYVHVDKDGRKWGMGAGHVRQGILFLLSIAFARLLFLPSSESLPAVVYVLVAFLGSAWLLSGLGFFLIYHRIPLFLVVITWVSCGGFIFHRPYVFRVVTDEDINPLPSAFEILCVPYTAVPPNAENPVAPQLQLPIRRNIAVAAVGGGIHSGAWAVEVLTRLQELDGGQDFPKRICAISGTSGGSYGAMHYAHEIYTSDGMEDCISGVPLNDARKRKLAKLRNIVQMPSLGAVVRSLAYNDLPGYFYPQFNPTDRGNAMEQQWAINANSGLDHVTLADWGLRSQNGRMPVVLFTAGTEESGRPTIFGSSRVANWNWNAEPVHRNPSGTELPSTHYTVPVVTGARLSASFPFVSPVARPDAKPSQLHRVEHHMDGGYYDNYGMVALNRWLEDGLTEMNRQFENVDKKPTSNGEEMARWEQRRLKWIKDHGFDRFLVIQIRYKSQDTDPKITKDGFFHQLAAPLNGLYNSRGTGQRLRADEQFDIFTRYWETKGIKIENALFDYEGDAPLSWHLTAGDKDKLKRQGEEIDKLRLLNPIGSSAHLVVDFIRRQKVSDK